MQLGASFKLGPFTVDAAGGLSPCDPAMAPAFLFRWHDRIVRARSRYGARSSAKRVISVSRPAAVIGSSIGVAVSSYTR